jgi:hypothetical protein
MKRAFDCQAIAYCSPALDAGQGKGIFFKGAGGLPFGD